MLRIAYLLKGLHNAIAGILPAKRSTELLSSFDCISRICVSMNEVLEMTDPC